jgi:hypothetical protein
MYGIICRHEVNEQNIPYALMLAPSHQKNKRKPSNKASHSISSGHTSTTKRKKTIPADAANISVPSPPSFVAQFNESTSKAHQRSTLSAPPTPLSHPPVPDSLADPALLSRMVESQIHSSLLLLPPQVISEIVQVNSDLSMHHT